MIIDATTLTSSNGHTNPKVKTSVPVKHHVPELFERKEVQNFIMTSSDGEKKKQKSKSAKKSKQQSSNTASEELEDGKATEIDENDLEELRSVYNKCMAVMKRIESKYGHLLDLEEPKSRKRKLPSSDTEESDSHECTCPVNKKIVFDEDGKEIITETAPQQHICVKKCKQTCISEQLNTNHVQVEYEPTNMSDLPDDLQTLANILRDPTIDLAHRNLIINRIKMLKQEYTDEIRFSKKNIIDKVKIDADEILNFTGSNLKTLPGYG